MKGFLLTCLVGMFIILAVATHLGVASAGQWITTDEVWDDGRPQPNETYTWSGGHDNDGYASGQGVLQWYVDGKPTNRYEGNMTRGKINGKGVCTFVSGNRYEGDWIDGRRTGRGTFTWANGSRYEGEFVKDQRTGKGVMTYANGGRYEGDWADGRWSGKGVMAYANGDRYEGDWVDDEQTGRGVKTFSDGRRWEGKWSKGGFIGPQSKYNGGFVVLLFIAVISSWVTRLALIGGCLSWRSLLKSSLIYLFCTFIAAFLLDFRLLGDFLMDWDMTDTGLKNPVINFLTFGLVTAGITGIRGKDGFPWRRARICFALYTVFTAILVVVWGVYVVIFSLFIMRLGGS